jgi:hypothetical protein
MPECNEWVPYAGTVYRQVVSDTVLNTSQGLIWNTSKMENLQEMGGFYLYEIRRSKDYWNFLQPGFLCLYCFVEYATNFPNPDALTFVEENDAALSICCLRLPEDEEAQMNVAIDQLEAETYYYVMLKMIRLQKDKEFTLWSESEWCCSWLWCNFGAEDCFQSCTMTTQSFTS